MNFNIYRVEKIGSYANKGDTINYDYTKDFEELKEVQGYIKHDYYITDSDLKLGNVYFSGDLIKVIAKITSFDGEPITIIPNKKRSKLGELNQGDHFMCGGVEWAKLDNAHDGCLVLAADVLFNKAFNPDEDAPNANNWKTAPLREHLDKKFMPTLIKAGAKSTDFIDFLRDLTTDDGETEYDHCEDAISMLTCDEYRRYRKYIPECGKWFWTITADSLVYSYSVRFVLSDGSLHFSGAYIGNGGVRPLCVLKSEIEVEQKC